MILEFKRKFKLWAYTISHSSLLIRSSMKFPNDDDYLLELSENIDIEFLNVTFMNIPNVLSEITINEIKEDLLPIFIDRKHCKYDQKIFQINDNECFYYVIASSILIGKNKWIDEDRVFNYDMNLIHDEILFTS